MENEKLVEEIKEMKMRIEILERNFAFFIDVLLNKDEDKIFGRNSSAIKLEVNKRMNR